MMRWLALGVLLVAGCSTMYPKLLDSPQMQSAIVEAIRDSNKTWVIDGKVTNPSIEFYYMVGFGGRVVGVDGHMGAQGAAGPQTRPADD